MLRILEGTPSHDWGQVKLLQHIIDKNKIPVDFKYINTIHIEHNARLNKTILYIPDEVSESAETTYELVNKALKDNNLKQVDIAFMHGYFNYQLPVSHKSAHNEDKYLNIVKQYICIGHVHIATVFKRILAPGSIDRTAHGEEGAKGGLLLSVLKDTSYLFVPNKNAAIYTTISTSHKSILSIIDAIKNKITKLPINSNIRLAVIDNTLVSGLVKELGIIYPNYKIKVVVERGTSVTDTSAILHKKIETTCFDINANNVEALLLKELDAKYTFDSSDIAIAKKELYKYI